MSTVFLYNDIYRSDVMLKFYYNPAYKYTNRTIIDVSSDTSFKELNYENIDSPDTINGHLIYQLEAAEKIPTYVVDTESGWKWFVSGITQLRTGKFQISLLRDLVSEGLDWTQENAYIEAGTASDFCKYKKWGLPFTNTKVGSQRLNFGGKSSFFVYYVNERSIGGGGATTESDFVVDYTTLPQAATYQVEVSDLNDIPHFNFVGAGPIRSWENLKGTLRISMAPEPYSFTSEKYYDITYDNQNYPNNFNINLAETSNSNILKSQIIWQRFNWTNATGSTYRQALSGNLQSFLNTYRANLGSSQSQTAILQLDDYVNKVIKVPNDLDPLQYDFYIIRRDRQIVEHNDFLPNSSTTALTTALRNSADLRGSFYDNSSWSNSGSGHLWFRSTEYISEYTLESLGTANTFTYTFKADTRKLPKSAVRCVNIVSDSTVSDQLLMQTLMLSQANPNVDEADNVGRIIDVQYLPFSIATQQNSNFVVGTHQLIAEFLDTDDFIYQTNLSSLTNINKETDSVYIVSPSRRSQFKFSPYNNDGLMRFSTKITIRPNQSIIYVRPTTQGLLLQDWDDKDCLVIQEDFSLTTINSAWTNYVYNNRNFQNSFNLQIQTKEFERSWERRIEQEQAKSDEWNSRNLSSQKAQTYTGNLPIISSLAGAVGTAWADEKYMAAAALDREYNEALYQKSMEVARQQFSYQIDNIKSQPLIPATITAIDCKMLDGIYLEFYSTNTTELNSIAQFYQYNGNRIDNYGTFASYWGPFVRGKIIISQKYTQPEIDELNRRLELGIFTGGITL